MFYCFEYLHIAAPVTRFVTHLKQENYVELATNKSKIKLSTDIWPFSAACCGFSAGHLPTLPADR
jgi:hypothetical protein